MLIGQYVNNADEKGRLLIPSKFRNEIAGNSVVVAPGIEDCLRLFTPESWEVVVNEITGSGHMFQLETRKAVRSLVSPASECEIDKAGRILLPQHLRERAGIVKEVLVMGAVEYIELWNPEVYAKTMEVGYDQLVDATEKIGQYYADLKKTEVAE